MPNKVLLEPTRLPISSDVEAMLENEQKLITPTRLIWLFITIVILIYSAIRSDLSFVELIQGSGNMLEIITRFFPPNFTDWRFYMNDILETVAMGIWGTLMAAIVAVPLGILSSENLCPYWIVFIVRRFGDAMRAINELVFAVIFIVAVGLGPFAGVLALFVHTTGTLGKLFSEAVESIDEGPVEGIRATGASKLQEIIFGVIPQVIPLWSSYVLYRFEANVRSASVLGFVGAGGIGVTLIQNFRAFKYQEVGAILIMLIVTVSIIDTISSTIRNRLV